MHRDRGVRGTPQDFRVESRASRTRLASAVERVYAAGHVGAVIYVRVSTKEQTENLSLPTQLRPCEEYCRRQGYEILERFHEEGESVKSTGRSTFRTCSRTAGYTRAWCTSWSCSI